METEPQSTRNLSYLEQMLMFGEMIGDCSCERLEKVQYYCWDNTCPNHASQQYYCARCSEDEPSKHNHRGKYITFSLPLSKQGWKEFHRTINEHLLIADAWFKKNETLMKLLEAGADKREEFLKKPTQDIKELRTLVEAINLRYQSVV